MRKGIKVNMDQIEKLMKCENLSETRIEKIIGVANWWQNMKRNGTTSEDCLNKLAMVLRVDAAELIYKDEPAQPERPEELLQKIEKLNEKLDLLHGENLEMKQKLESMPEMIAQSFARYQSAEAWLFAKLKHSKEGISESNLKVLAQNNGINEEELQMAVGAIEADRYKRGGNTWLSLYRTV